jgi:hypothetical protein
MNNAELTTLHPRSSPSSPTILSRKCACGQHSASSGNCEGCKKETLRLSRSAANRLDSSSSLRDQRGIPSAVHEVLSTSGEPLDFATRKFMEARFGSDFSQVRVHTDKKAAESAWQVNALAYTAGRDIVFGAGLYAPGTGVGRRLLAHELSHVLQQGAASGRAGLQVGATIDPADSPSERQADGVADLIMSMEGPATLNLNTENTHDQATQRVTEAVVSNNVQTRRIALPDSAGYRLSRTWDWRKAACHAACWAAGGAITAIVAIACAAGTTVSLGGLAIPCTWAIVATAAAAGAGSSLCADLCDHALAPPEAPGDSVVPQGGAAPSASPAPAD